MYYVPSAKRLHFLLFRIFLSRLETFESPAEHCSLLLFSSECASMGKFLLKIAASGVSD